MANLKNLEAYFEVSVQEKLNEDGFYESPDHEKPWEGLTPSSLNIWFTQEKESSLLKKYVSNISELDAENPFCEYDFIEFSGSCNEDGSFVEDGQFVADWRLYVRINCIPLNGSEIIELLNQ